MLGTGVTHVTPLAAHLTLKEPGPPVSERSTFIVVCSSRTTLGRTAVAPITGRGLTARHMKLNPGASTTPWPTSATPWGCASFLPLVWSNEDGKKTAYLDQTIVTPWPTSATPWGQASFSPGAWLGEGGKNCLSGSDVGERA